MTVTPAPPGDSPRSAAAVTREPAGASSSTPVDTVSRSVPVDSHVDGVHVLHVIDRLSMGGTQNLLWRSLGELSRRGVESH
ncbi:MAG: hypothetical protein AB7U20_22155, partial [Planctomycetaceae bacterium]